MRDSSCQVTHTKTHAQPQPRNVRPTPRRAARCKERAPGGPGAVHAGYCDTTRRDAQPNAAGFCACGWIAGSTPCTAGWPDVADAFAGIQREEWPAVQSVAGHCVDAWCPVGFNEPFNRTAVSGGGFEANEGNEVVSGCATPPGTPEDRHRYCCYPRESAWLDKRTRGALAAAAVGAAPGAADAVVTSGGAAAAFTLGGGLVAAMAAAFAV